MVATADAAGMRRSFMISSTVGRVDATGVSRITGSAPGRWKFMADTAPVGDSSNVTASPTFARVARRPVASGGRRSNDVLFGSRTARRWFRMRIANSFAPAASP